MKLQREASKTSRSNSLRSTTSSCSSSERTSPIPRLATSSSPSSVKSQGNLSPSSPTGIQEESSHPVGSSGKTRRLSEPKFSVFQEEARREALNSSKYVHSSFDGKLTPQSSKTQVTTNSENKRRSAPRKYTSVQCPGGTSFVTKTTSQRSDEKTENKQVVKEKMKVSGSSSSCSVQCESDFCSLLLIITTI